MKNIQNLTEWRARRMSYGKASVDCVHAFIANTNIKDPVADLKQLWRDKSNGLSKAEDCPKSTFLGLCSSGCVVGIPALAYTRSVDNRRYGETAVTLLKAFPPLGKKSEDELWGLVATVLKACAIPIANNHNYQMQVVLGLWKAGLIV